MIAAFSDLREKFLSCCCDGCQVPPCALKLSGFPRERFILDIDCAHEQRTRQFTGIRCDHIIVSYAKKAIYFIPVEFKTGKIDTKHVRKQLEACIHFVRRHVRHEVRCYPVLVSREEPPFELLEMKIAVSKTRAARVRHVRCNKTLKWSDVVHRRGYARG